MIQSSIQKFVPAVLLAAFVGMVPSLSAAVIYLNNPVINSLTPDALYWNYDSETGGSVADGSGNGYSGVLTQGLNDNSTNPVNTPTLGTGVNLAGTSGYGSGVSVIGKNDDPNYNSTRNPNVTVAPGSTPAYSMADGASFTAGTWLNMNTAASIVPDAAYINLYVLNSGLMYSTSSHWGLGLHRDNSVPGQWYFTFSTGNGTSNSIRTLPIDATILDDTWHHMGINFNGDTNEITFWLDGVSLGTLTMDHGIGAPTTEMDRSFRVGERMTFNYQEISYTGLFDDTFVTSGIHSFAAVPEPSSLALLGIAGLWAAGATRRSCRS